MLLSSNINSVYVGEMPEQTLTQEELKRYYDSEEEWYARCVRYIAGRYNKPTFINDGSINSQDRNLMMNISPAQEMWRNHLYFHGQQPNDAYAFWFQDNASNELLPGGRGSFVGAVPDEKGNTAYELISHLIGSFSGRIEYSKLTISNNSKKGVSLKTLKRKKALFIELMKRSGLFDVLANKGVKYNPFPAASAMDFDAINEYINSYPEEVEAMKLMRDIIFRNGTKDLIKNGFANVAMNRYAGIYVYTDEKGMVRHSLVPSQNMVIDQHADEDFSLNDRYAGFVEFLQPGRIIEKFKIEDDDEIKRIRGMATGRTGGNDFYQSEKYNFPWWFENQGTVACFTAFWKSYSYDDSGMIYQVVRKGTLIGNQILKSYGLEKDIVHNPFQPNECVLPLISVRPYTFSGYNRSIMDRLRPVQDKIDLYNRKIAQEVAKSLGKGTVIYADNLPESIHQIVSDLKKYGLTVLQRNTGEIGDDDERRRFLENIDLSPGSYLSELLALKEDAKRDAKEIASTSDIALGQQQQYVGLNTQMNAIAQNTKGVEVYMSSCLQWYANVLQYSIEKIKLSMIGNKELQRELLDENGITYLEMSKDLSFMELGVHITNEGLIDSEKKTRLTNIALEFARARQIDMRDYINIEKANTLSELEKYFDIALRKKEKKEAEMMAAKQAMQQQNIMLQNQGLQGLEAQKQQGQNIRQDKELAMEGAKAGMSLAENAAREASNR